MENTSDTKASNETRDIIYFRHRLRNRMFSVLVSFFEKEAKTRGVTKKDIAAKLSRDPSQVTRWLSTPANMTLDSISDILFALDAEMKTPEVLRFMDQRGTNFVHPLVAAVQNKTEKRPTPITVQLPAASNVEIITDSSAQSTQIKQNIRILENVT